MILEVQPVVAQPVQVIFAMKRAHRKSELKSRTTISVSWETGPCFKLSPEKKATIKLAVARQETTFFTIHPKPKRASLP
jgi:hypothetical protein